MCVGGCQRVGRTVIIVYRCVQLSESAPLHVRHFLLSCLTWFSYVGCHLQMGSAYHTHLCLVTPPPTPVHLQCFPSYMSASLSVCHWWQLWCKSCFKSHLQLSTAIHLNLVSMVYDVVRAHSCVELIPIANGWATTQQDVSILRSLSVNHLVSSWQRPPVRNILPVSIINSGVFAHQFTISVHEQGLHNLLVVCIEVFMFVWFVYHVNTVHVHVVLTCSECSVHTLLLCTLVPFVMALFPCVPCHVTCMCMCALDEWDGYFTPYCHCVKVPIQRDHGDRVDSFCKLRLSSCNE